VSAGPRERWSSLSRPRETTSPGLDKLDRWECDTHARHRRGGCACLRDRGNAGRACRDPARQPHQVSTSSTGGSATRTHVTRSRQARPTEGCACLRDRGNAGRACRDPVRRPHQASTSSTDGSATRTHVTRPRQARPTEGCACLRDRGNAGRACRDPVRRPHQVSTSSTGGSATHTHVTRSRQARPTGVRPTRTSPGLDELDRRHPDEGAQAFLLSRQAIQSSTGARS